MVSKKYQQRRPLQVGEAGAQLPQHAISCMHQAIVVVQGRLRSLCTLGRPWPMVFHGYRVDQRGFARRPRQIQDFLRDGGILDVTPRLRLPGERFQAHQLREAGSGQDAIATVEAHIVRVDEQASPLCQAQPPRQSMADFSHRGEKRVEFAETQRILLAAEQHPVFGAHGIGAESAHQQIAPLHGLIARLRQHRQGQRCVGKQFHRIGEAFALHDHDQR